MRTLLRVIEAMVTIIVVLVVLDYFGINFDVIGLLVNGAELLKKYTAELIESVKLAITTLSK